MSKNKYETHVAPYLHKIERWVTMGATAKEVAQKLHVSYSTLRLYLSKGDAGEEPYSALSAVFTRACEEPDDEVEAALYKRACGFTAVEITVEEKYFPQTGETMTLTKHTQRVFPPDPTSAMFWLTNRRPDKWQYKRQGTEGESQAGENGVILMPEVKSDG